MKNKNIDLVPILFFLLGLFIIVNPISNILAYDSGTKIYQTIDGKLIRVLSIDTMKFSIKMGIAKILITSMYYIIPVLGILCSSKKMNKVIILILDFLNLPFMIATVMCFIKDRKDDWFKDKLVLSPDFWISIVLIIAIAVMVLLRKDRKSK